MRPSVALLRKDLLLERRAPEAVPAMLLFTITTFVLFHFGLRRDTVSGALAAGVLLVTLLFAAILGMNRLFVSEQEEGGFDGLLLAPIDRTALFVAKACALFLFLALVEVVAVAAFALLLPAAGLGITSFVVVICAGFAAYDVRLRENAMLGVGLAVFAVVLFVIVLGLPIPIWPW